VSGKENQASDLVERARRYACEAHQRIDHRRKYTGQNYEVHLKAVATLVGEVGSDAAAIAAAWLHDTVEDTPATIQDIETEFGVDVAALVSDLTDVSRPGDANRATRKATDRAHTAASSPHAKTVKLADLIDNCQDITRHDPRFAPVFLDEMRALLEVLGEGDAELLRRAHRIHARSVAALEHAPVVALEPLAPASGALDHAQQHVARLFVETFTARDIASALRSFDADRDAGEVRALMDAEGLEVVGIREAGMVTGYLRAGDVAGSTCGAAARSFSAGEVVEADASLADVVLVLTRHDHCFVKMLGQVTAVLRRADVNNPVVRMWLFGIVSIVEMALVRRVTERYPDDSWTIHVPAARLALARKLLEERRRRDRACTLLDCLQLPDKAGILVRDGSFCEWLDFKSARSAKQAVKEVESLRNHLAHAQDIATHDWAQIARFARRVEEIVRLEYRD